MNGMITTKGDFDLDAVKTRLKAYKPSGLVEAATIKESYTLECGQEKADGKTGENETAKTVAMVHCGALHGMDLFLQEKGCKVTVYPAFTSAEEILKEKPDGIFLSDGPGDPAENGALIGEVKKLMESGIPMFAVGLGHQLAALAAGGKTCRLKYGHHGGNYPVKDLVSGRVYISSHNHNYAVDADSVKDWAEPAFINVNDQSNEGLSYKERPVFTVQFKPETSSDSPETGCLFDRFMEMMEEKTNA